MDQELRGKGQSQLRAKGLKPLRLQWTEAICIHPIMISRVVCWMQQTQPVM